MPGPELDDEPDFDGDSTIIGDQPVVSVLKSNKRPPRLEQAIAAHLGEPHEDPHGHPIPTSTGELLRRELRRLSEFASGDTVVIREAQDDNPERLRHWQELGLTPGATVHILSYQPLDDLFEVEVGGRLVRLGSEGLAGLRGEPLSAPGSAVG